MFKGVYLDAMIDLIVEFWMPSPTLFDGILGQSFYCYK